MPDLHVKIIQNKINEIRQIMDNKNDMKVSEKIMYINRALDYIETLIQLGAQNV